MSEKTCDERQFLLGFVRSSQVFPRTVTGFRTFVPDPPQCLLGSSSLGPRILLDWPRNPRRQRGGIEEAKR